MKSIKKSERILGIINVLKKYSDEENELTLQEIIDYLHEEFIDEVEFSKVAISNDLKELSDSKYVDIIINNERNGLPKYYSYKNRLIEIQELRLLMDAISSARFITKKDKEKILEKIKRLTSLSLANNLQNQIYLEDYAISGANRVKYTIFTLHNAIHEKK
ncbi:hypothetical protein CV093_06100 [Oceanobacillus sp. 143]|nr:hypothetical protein CV093_06100 [Oceanobacillus sp. 143]